MAILVKVVVVRGDYSASLNREATLVYGYNLVNMHGVNNGA